MGEASVARVGGIRSVHDDAGRDVEVLPGHAPAPLGTQHEYGVGDVLDEADRNSTSMSSTGRP